MTEDRADICDLLCLDLPHAERIRAELPPLGAVEQSAAAARALADPTRLTIAAALHTGGELCVCDMAWVVGQAQNLVSHHLRQLKIGGLVSSRRQGRLVMYALTPRGQRLVATVLGDELTAATVAVPSEEVHNG
ncbi:metalloregulator ArsR/SmtB family transcription factor [Nocardia sp. NPDC051787]|uniref:ArsR/SmtB family transcription factor n=1 Tax=Nocardia sp. NPDC051787 TaxID=3155415 RepID=UPI00343AED43